MEASGRAVYDIEWLHSHFQRNIVLISSHMSLYPPCAFHHIFNFLPLHCDGSSLVQPVHDTIRIIHVLWGLQPPSISHTNEFSTFDTVAFFQLGDLSKEDPVEVILISDLLGRHNERFERLHTSQWQKRWNTCVRAAQNLPRLNSTPLEPADSLSSSSSDSDSSLSDSSCSS